jgi:hypothetical protein
MEKEITVYLVRGMLSEDEVKMVCEKLELVKTFMPGGLYAVYTEHENEAGKLGKQVDEICLEMESARLLKPLAE